MSVLLGVGTLNLEAFEHFAGSFASRLDIDQSALRSWVRQVCGMGPTSVAQDGERNVWLSLDAKGGRIADADH